MERMVFRMGDGLEVTAYLWKIQLPKAIVVIIHGLAEHAKRYDEFARKLNEAGYTVVAPDLRGHGETAQQGILGSYGRRRGWRLVAEDIWEVTGQVADLYPPLPIFLFGHSVGSMFARTIIAEHSERYRACVLSGVMTTPKAKSIAGGMAANLLCFLGRAEKPSRLLHKATMASNNKPFEPGRTPFDWLSRDEQVVDAYVADSQCGFVCTTGLYRDLADMSRFIDSPAAFCDLPGGYPVNIITGGSDAVGSMGKAGPAISHRYLAAGCKAVCTVYPQARHELINENNRDQVMTDVISYFNQFCD